MKVNNDRFYDNFNKEDSGLFKKRLIKTLRDVVESVDEVFGEGYSKKNPKIIIELIDLNNKWEGM